MDPKVGSIDVESYGKVEGMPSQTCFTPRRCMEVDGATREQLVVVVSLTLPKEDPRCFPDRGNNDALGALQYSQRVGGAVHTASEWNAKLLSKLTPGKTLLFRPDRRQELHMLVRWLRWLDTLVGMNLQYDLGMLRARHPLLRDALDGRQTIVDLGVVNYLQCEGRSERSLKTIGPVLGKYLYDEGDLVEKLPDGPELEGYCNQDTVNAMVAVSHLAGMIARSGQTDKLSPWCVQFYSDTIWSCVRMTEEGVPFDRPTLEELEGRVRRRMEGAKRLAESQYGVVVAGEGSQKSRMGFMRGLIERIPAALNHPLLEFTEKKKELSLGERNQTLLGGMLPDGAREKRAIRLMSMHGKAQKILSTYIMPLLKHKAGKPDPAGCRRGA